MQKCETLYTIRHWTLAKSFLFAHLCEKAGAAFDARAIIQASTVSPACAAFYKAESFLFFDVL
jgi:hypothetical protein